MTTDRLTTIERIRLALDELQEIHGMEYLTYEVVGAASKTWIRCQLRRLESDGEIYVQRSNGGRGQKNIIRKRNRNSPGYPRKVER